MLAKKSPLILKNFLLLRQTIEFIPPSSKDIVSIQELTDSYPIDIDFVIQDMQKPTFQLFVKIEVNVSSPKLPGYSIFSEGAGVFEFDESIVNTEKDKGNLLYYSGVPICINSLRSIISNVTSHAPFGKYTLPSIDVNELLKDKGVIRPKQTPKSKPSKKQNL